MNDLPDLRKNTSADGYIRRGWEAGKSVALIHREAIRDGYHVSISLVQKRVRALRLAAARAGQPDPSVRFVSPQ